MNVRSLVVVALAMALATPALADEAHSWRCGTPALLPLLTHDWDELTPQQQAAAWDVVGLRAGDDPSMPPPMGGSCNGTAPNEQESEHFVVKWGTSYDGTGVDDLLEALEAARAVFVDDYGYGEPYGVGSGWKLPIFVGNSGNGLPTIGWSGGYATVCGDHPGGYIVLSQDIAWWDFAADVGPHELFHTVQFGYGNWHVDGWWWEATAVWSQDLTYPDLNGYVAFLGEYTNGPHLPLETEDIRQYGMFIFPMTLEEFVDDGAEVIRRSWAEPGGPIPESLDTILQDGHDSSFHDAFAEFAGRSAVMDDYEDGALFGEPVRADTVSSYPDDGTVENNLPQHYGLNFIELQAPSDAEEPNTKLRFEFDGGGSGDWLLGSVKHRIEDGLHRTWRTDVDGEGKVTVEVIDFGTLYDQVVVGVVHTGNGTGPAYSWSAEIVEQTEPQGDDDDDAPGDDPGALLDGCLASPSPYSYTAETLETSNACAVAGGGPGVAAVVVIGVLGGVIWGRRRT